jgi:hypothetical protein
MELLEQQVLLVQRELLEKQVQLEYLALKEIKVTRVTRVTKVTKVIAEKKEIKVIPV